MSITDNCGRCYCLARKKTSQSRTRTVASRGVSSRWMAVDGRLSLRVATSWDPGCARQHWKWWELLSGGQVLLGGAWVPLGLVWSGPVSVLVLKTGMDAAQASQVPVICQLSGGGRWPRGWHTRVDSHTPPGLIDKNALKVY
jgi:hypothetical protein